MAYGNANILTAEQSTFETNVSQWSTTGTGCTSAVQTTTKLSGTYALRVTATVAGSTAIWLTTRAPVVAGTEYVCRVPIGLATTQAGLTSALTIEWWSAVTGGTQISTVSGTTVNVSSTAGWDPSGYPVIVATAPAGATHAVVKVAVNGVALNAQWFIDDVYLGAAVVRTGNILGYNTASAEMDASGWKVDSGTLARTAVNMVSGLGYYVAQFTTGASGDQLIRTNSFIGVVVGKEYTGYAAVRSLTAAVPWVAEFRWYDGAFAEIGTRSGTTYTPALNTTAYIGITATAPAGAVYCKLYLRPQATASAQVFQWEDAQLFRDDTLNPAGNLLTYLEYSAEGRLPAWSVDNGTVSLLQVTSAITDGKFASALTPTVTGTIRATIDRLVPVTANSTYQVKGVVFRHNTDIAQKVVSAFRFWIDWYDSAGNLFLADNPDQFYSAEMPDEWWSQIISETRTCPEGAAYAKVGVEVTSDNPLIDYYYVDNVSLIQAAAEYTLETSNDTGCVTLTVHYVPDSTSSTSNLTIQRMDEDGKASSMRAYGRTWDLAPNPFAPIVVEDYEAPLGSRVWYSVQWSSSTGVTKGPRLFTQSVDAPVLADGDYVWFKSPGVPALNTTVIMEAPLKWARAARGTRYDIVGRRNPLHVTGPRAGRTSSITVLIWDQEANAQFDSLLDAGTAALVQAMPGYGIEGNLYVSVGDAEVEPLSPDARDDGWRWTLPVTEVDRPDGGLQGSAGATWQTILDNVAYPTWEALFNAHDTWADVLTKG